MISDIQSGSTLIQNAESEANVLNAFFLTFQAFSVPDVPAPIVNNSLHKKENKHNA